MVKCIHCSKIIISKDKEWLKRAKFCSYSCRSKHLFSGKNNPFFGKTHTKENRKKISESTTFHQTGKRSKNWKGGKRYDKNGYILIYKPEWGTSEKNGYVFEHRFIMEQNIGRFLTRKEIIHHLNEKKDDNRIENLYITDRSKHLCNHRFGYRKYK